LFSYDYCKLNDIKGVVLLINKTRDILLKTSPFNKLPKSVIDNLVNTAHFETFAEYEFVFREKEPLNDVYIVIDGMAMAILTMSSGEESVIEFFRPGNFFGEAAAMAGSIPPISVQSVQPLTCLVISRHMLSELIHNSPAFSEEMTRTISERLLKIYRELHEEISHHKHGIETISLRKKIGEFMTSPVLTCPATAKITEIAKLFLEHKISSIVVTKKDETIPIGIVTESDLIKKVIAKEMDINKVSAIQIMGHPLHLIDTNDYYYDALLKMVQNHIKHLPVIENNNLIGIVTVKDLMKAQRVGTLSIVDSIEKQSTIEGLTKAKTEIDKVLEALINEQAPAHDISTIITEFNDRLTRKIIKICEQEMINEGLGLPPTDYCWLSLGSAGRQELIFHSYQKNAILYNDPPPNRNTDFDLYFQTLADKVVNGLEKCGFPKCALGITAQNSKWRLSYSKWIQTINGWVNSNNHEEIAKSVNMLDFRFLYGKKRIAEDLRYHILNTIKPATMFVHYLTVQELNKVIPLGILGEIITPNSRHGLLDIKIDGYLHIVNCIRLFALRFGAETTSTFNRIDELTELGHFSKYEAKKYKEAFDILLYFSIKSNINKIKQNKKSDNLISIILLGKDDQELLKEALSITQNLQLKTKSFLITSFNNEDISN